ncbi:neutral zinc metallopeptidase [Arthrobacter sulfonylureivorans]|uniref:Peptidase n=1 Tax=Arthrobacter sulfonylureivorans TaxID=2486855 RepID=A0ABY3W3S9_9MICC|nr:neutral zinc metallopeptidase [Arthrobacter sulfonylureivorans]UNK44511.1 hypothetical protein MNQ99_10925 [Arthrobacter sulfonylureivorans]
MTGETKNRWGVIAGLLLAMTLGLSGCGGSGDSGSSTANQGGADSAEIGSGADGGDTPIEGPGVQTLGDYSQYGQTPSAEVSGNDASGAGQAGNDTNAITSEELADIQTAQAITDQFWRTHWSELFTGTYTPPTVVGLYDGRDPSNAPTCAGKPLQPGNAFYCIPEDYVAWDASLMERGFQFGDAWPYLVIAHEWSHAIANRLDPSLRSQAYELQADCLAGATLYGAAADGTLIFEQGDQDELVTALSSLGGNTPWTNPQDHGDSSERVANFNVGRTGGVLACLPSQQ